MDVTLNEIKEQNKKFQRDVSNLAFSHKNLMEDTHDMMDLHKPSGYSGLTIKIIIHHKNGKKENQIGYVNNANVFMPLQKTVSSKSISKTINVKFQVESDTSKKITLGNTMHILLDNTTGKPVLLYKGSGVKGLDNLVNPTIGGGKTSNDAARMAGRNVFVNEAFQETTATFEGCGYLPKNLDTWTKAGKEGETIESWSIDQCQTIANRAGAKNFLVSTSPWKLNVFDTMAEQAKESTTTASVSGTYTCGNIDNITIRNIDGDNCIIVTSKNAPFTPNNELAPRVVNTDGISGNENLLWPVFIHKQYYLGALWKNEAGKYTKVMRWCLMSDTCNPALESSCNTHCNFDYDLNQKPVQHATANPIINNINFNTYNGGIGFNKMATKANNELKMDTRPIDGQDRSPFSWFSTKNNSGDTFITIMGYALNAQNSQVSDNKPPWIKGPMTKQWYPANSSNSMDIIIGSNERCPKTHPYPLVWSQENTGALLCYDNENYVKGHSGSCGSWCTLDTGPDFSGGMCGNNDAFAIDTNTKPLSKNGKLAGTCKQSESYSGDIINNYIRLTGSIGIYQNITVQPNVRYTGTIWVCKTGGNPAEIEIGLRENKKTKVFVSIPLTDNWSEQSFYFIPVSTQVEFVIQQKNQGGIGLIAGLKFTMPGDNNSENYFSNTTMLDADPNQNFTHIRDCPDWSCSSEQEGVLCGGEGLKDSSWICKNGTWEDIVKCKDIGGILLGTKAGPNPLGSYCGGNIIVLLSSSCYYTQDPVESIDNANLPVALPIQCASSSSNIEPNFVFFTMESDFIAFGSTGQFYNVDGERGNDDYGDPSVSAARGELTPIRYNIQFICENGRPFPCESLQKYKDPDNSDITEYESLNTELEITNTGQIRIIDRTNNIQLLATRPLSGFTPDKIVPHPAWARVEGDGNGNVPIIGGVTQTPLNTIKTGAVIRKGQYLLSENGSFRLLFGNIGDINEKNTDPGWDQGFLYGFGIVSMTPNLDLADKIVDPIIDPQGAKDKYDVCDAKAQIPVNSSYISNQKMFGANSNSVYIQFAAPVCGMRSEIKYNPALKTYTLPSTNSKRMLALTNAPPVEKKGPVPPKTVYPMASFAGSLFSNPEATNTALYNTIYVDEYSIPHVLGNNDINYKGDFVFMGNYVTGTKDKMDCKICRPKPGLDIEKAELYIQNAINNMTDAGDNIIGFEYDPTTSLVTLLDKSLYMRMNKKNPDNPVEFYPPNISLGGQTRLYLRKPLISNERADKLCTSTVMLGKSQDIVAQAGGPYSNNSLIKPMPINKQCDKMINLDTARHKYDMREGKVMNEAINIEKNIEKLESRHDEISNYRSEMRKDMNDDMTLYEYYFNEILDIIKSGTLDAWVDSSGLSLVDNSYKYVIWSILAISMIMFIMAIKKK